MFNANSFIYYAILSRKMIDGSAQIFITFIFDIPEIEIIFWFQISGKNCSFLK